MQDLFISTTAAAIITRIQKLTPGSHPLWGKMTVAQMLAHCQVPLQVAVGEKKLKRNLAGILFGRLAKKKLMRDKPFAKNLPTDRSFVVADQRDFEQEKNKLIDLVERFSKGGPGGLADEPHPFFGKLTAEEWTALSYKHLDHHLQQFGV